MTELDLRVEYKRDTGKYPIYNDTIKQWSDSGSLFSDKLHSILKSSYISWLENKFENSRLIRDLYIKEGNNNPVKENTRYSKWYWSKAKQKSVEMLSQNVNDYFIQDYDI